MKFFSFLLFGVCSTFCSFSQHCPWDCSGMILLQTNIPKEKLYKLQPVLVDENKNEITDTVYGTGKDTYDKCEFLSYEDFTAYRTKKIAIHYWYGYDTFYHFTKGGYIVKYNFCKYEGKKLYLRFRNTKSVTSGYQYIEIPGDKRMHLHNYNRELTGRETGQLQKMTKPFIRTVNCTQLGFPDNECN